MTTVQQINAALKRYYALHGVKYKDEFQLYWEESGFDDLHDEITTDISNSMLLEFDDNIPFKTEPENKDQAIYDLLLKIYRNPLCDFYHEISILKVNAVYWKMSREDIKRVHAVHDEQLETLWTGHVQRDKNILTMISISLKIGVPYLLYLVDLYNRDRFVYFKYAAADSKSKILSEMEWVNKNRYCTLIRKTQPRATDTIKHGILSFFRRVAPKLRLQSEFRVQDSLQAIAEYIQAQINFVHAIANQDQTSCPFQKDAVIIFDKVLRIKGPESIQIQETLDEEEEEDDDDDDEDDNNVQQKLNEKTFVDVIGNIRDRLKYERCIHEVTSIVSDYQSDEKSNADKKSGFRVKRAYDEMYRKFTDTLIRKKGKEYKNYPRNHRFCSLVDRRVPNEKNANYEVSKEDEMIFYEPPNTCNKIPKNEVDLWYFDSSKTCILPPSDKKESQLNIGSDQGASGTMLILSFHVLSVNEIRAYLYWNGKVMRFLPQDIIEMLPLIFVESKGNETFARSIAAKRIVNEIKNKLKDKKFEEFYKAYGAKR